MTPKRIVCLANSKKHGERCIAGIEVAVKPEGGYVPVREGGSPRWIRPVSPTSHGEVPVHVVRDIQLLDIVEFMVREEVGTGYQSENVTFDERHVAVVDRLPRTADLLEHFVAKPSATIFGNRGKAVHPDQIHRVDHSLMLIGAERVSFRSQPSSSGKPQVRATFRFGENEYDLPVTDPDFETTYLKDPHYVDRFGRFYFTLSLGVEHEGWYYKLVAGVIAA